MTRIDRSLGGALIGLAAVLFVAGESRAEWGRYRAVTSYSFPSVPVYTQRVVVQGVYRPVVVAPAAAPAVVNTPIAVAPPIVMTQPQTSYYLPAAPVVVGSPAVLPATVVARPAFWPRARRTYYAPVVVPAPVILP